MLGIFELGVILLGIITIELGNTAPLIRLYFGDKIFMSQLIWVSIIFLIGAVILIYNGINM